MSNKLIPNTTNSVLTIHRYIMNGLNPVGGHGYWIDIELLKGRASQIFTSVFNIKIPFDSVYITAHREQYKDIFVSFDQLNQLDKIITISRLTK